MGCNTYFYRPVTEEEISILRSKFDENYVSFLGEEGICLVEGYKSTVFQFEIDKVIDSYNSSDLGLWIHWLDIADDLYVFDGKLYVDTCRSDYTYKSGYDCLDRKFILSKPGNPIYRDNFRIKGFYHEKWIIHNKRELKHKLRKHYYELTEEELNQVKQFWKDYPGGVIRFA